MRLLRLLLFGLGLGLGLFWLLLIMWWGGLLLRRQISGVVGIVSRGVSASCCCCGCGCWCWCWCWCRSGCRRVDRGSDADVSAYLKIKVLADLQPEALRAASLPSRRRATLLLLLLLWLLLILLLLGLALLVLCLLGLGRACGGWLHKGVHDALAEAGVQRTDGGEERAYEHGGRGPELRACGRSEAQCRCCGCCCSGVGGGGGGGRGPGEEERDQWGGGPEDEGRAGSDEGEWDEGEVDPCVPGPARRVFCKQDVEEVWADELAHGEGAVSRKGEVNAC